MKSPITSVLVSMYNKRESVLEIIDKMFLPSLIRNGSKDKELIIIDDCSPLENRTKEIIGKHMPLLKSKFGKVLFLRNPKNLGFGGSYNKAIFLSKGKYIVIVNDDVYLPKKSIDYLIQPLTIDKSIGSVGPITGWRGVCTPQYCKQGPKLTAYDTGNFQNIENFAIKIRKLLKNEPPIDYFILTGFCFAMPGKLLKDLGGFDDKTFLHGTLEDTDLIRRIRLTHKNRIAPSVYIHHGGLEGASVSFNQNILRREKAYYINCYKYARKWKDYFGLIKLWITSGYHMAGLGTVSDLIDKKIKSN